MLFSQLAGNESIKEQLRHMVDTQTLPAVLLFHGHAGVKQRIAEELALHLLGALNPSQTGVAVGSKHPDFHQLFPDKNGLHSIAAIRELIVETTLPPFAAKAKVFIVHSAEKMLPTSSNALLKTLEEPPPATWIILLSADVNTMLPTVISRCRMVAFPPFDAMNREVQDSKVASLLEILQSDLLLGEGHWFPLFQQLEEGLKETEKETSNSEERPEKHQGEAYLSVLIYWIRDLCLLQAGGDPSRIYYQEHKLLLERQSQALRPLSLQKIYAMIERAQARLACNMRLAIVLEECLLNLHHLAHSAK